LLTLFTTPMVYIYQDWINHWISQRRGRGAREHAPEMSAVAAE
jgi:hypothetical protein